MEQKGFAKSWLAAFGSEVDKKMIRDHVTAAGNYLWHLFSWCGVPCLKGDAAKKAFDTLSYTEAIRFCGGFGGSVKKPTTVGKLSAKELDDDPEGDIYIVAKDYSWTYVRTHEKDMCGPYFCERK